MTSNPDYTPLVDIIQGHFHKSRYNDVIMTTIASQITSLTVVYSTVYSDADQRKHQSSASLAFVWGIHRDRWIPRTKGQLRGKCFHLMTSSCFELLLDCSLWLNVNVVCGPQDKGFPTVLMSAATGCIFAKLGWNKIEHQNTFFKYFDNFYLISGNHWNWKCHFYLFLVSTEIENVICVLAFRGLHENMISLLFH